MDRDFILDEIRRCAAENGGVPLGKGRFREETGIREHDWAGKFWVRWSEAIEEAGFQRNSLNAALPDEELLRSLAFFTRELDHYPVEAELRLRARRGDGFPSSSTFRRLGNRLELIERLAAYCATDEQLADVSAICSPLLTTVDTDTAAIAHTSAAMVGTVYLAKSGKHYKIGRTNNTGRRLNEIRIQLPEQLTLVHSIETDDAPGIEHYWHRRFADKNTNKNKNHGEKGGEFFLLTRADVAAFRRRRFM